MKLVVIVAMVAIGCGGKSASRAQAPQPARAAQTEIVQTTEITSAAMPSAKGLDSRQIRERVDSRMAELVDRCGELQWDTDRYETTLHLEIAPNGSVDVADARGTHTRLDACVAEVSRGWTFDRAGTRTITSVPVVIERP